MIIATLSLVTAFVFGIFNYYHTKRSIEKAVSPYLKVLTKVKISDNKTPELIVEIENLHNEVAIDSLRITPQTFKLKNVKIPFSNYLQSVIRGMDLIERKQI